MPPIYHYKCNKCRELFAEYSSGSIAYLEEIETGKRANTPHPSEWDWTYFKNAFGYKPGKCYHGYLSDCICLKCLTRFRLDLGYRPKPARDKRECPLCKSKKVKTIDELKGKKCPKCKKGIVITEFAGSS